MGRRWWQYRIKSLVFFMKICVLPSSKHLLDFSEAFALGFGYDEQDEEKCANAAHAEDPKRYGHAHRFRDRLKVPKRCYIGTS